MSFLRTLLILLIVTATGFTFASTASEMSKDRNDRGEAAP